MFVKLTGDLESIFMRQLFRSFGMNVNVDAFEQLSRSVHKTIIHRHRNNLTDMEAILFGQSGLLPSVPVDGYSAELMYRYTNVRYKYNLVPMNTEAWKFERWEEFPTIRIAQLTALLHQEENLYARCMHPQTSLTELRTILKATAADYWEEHLRFGVATAKQMKEVDEEIITSILYEAVVPIREFFRL